MKKKLSFLKLLAILFLMPVFLSAQHHVSYNKPNQEEIDSLLKELPKAKEDTNKVLILKNIAFNYRFTDQSEAMDYAKRSLALAEKMNWKKGIGIAYNVIGVVFFNEVKYDSAIKYYKNSMDIFEKLKTHEWLQKVLRNITLLHTRNKEYNKALEYIDIRLSVARDIKDTLNEAKALFALGNIYRMTRKYNKALEYYKNSKLLFEKIDNKKRVANNLINIGNVNRKIRNYKEAIANFKKAEKIMEKINEKRGVILALINMGNIYDDMGNLPEANKCFRKSKNVASENKDKEMLALSYQYLGNNALMEGKIDSSEHYFNKAIKLNKELNNDKKNAAIYNSIGINHKQQGNISKALEYFHKFLKISESNKDTFSIGRACHNIGVIHSMNKNNDKAINYFLKSLSFARAIKDSSMIVQSLISLGNQYSEKDSIEKAYEMYLEAHKMPDNIKKQYQIMYLNNSLGHYYNKYNQTDKALKLFQKVYKLSKKLKYRKFEISALNYIGWNYIKKGNQEDSLYNIYGREGIGSKIKSKRYFRTSIDHFERALDIINETNIREVEYNIYQGLSKAYEMLGENQKALESYKKYTALNDSIQSFENKKKIEILEAIREKEQMDAEIKMLNKEKEFEKEQKRTIIIASVFGIILLMILAYVLYRRYRFKTKAENLLKEKNTEIRSAHKRITDSITYASGIQSAVLPFDSRVSEFLQEYFVLFIPKDIVSGDFYWIEKIDGRIVIVVGDCTGHGVPGAFMSMIGNELLNNIVIKQRIFDPAQVLSEMHKDVRFALKQDESISSTHDGMDVCICVIEGDNLTFAGAKRPLYYVQNNEFHEIKGDRKSIGGRQKEEERVFTNHEIAIDSQTMLYLTTDGYQDQHNINQEKFGVKRFRELLFSISDKSMQEQKEILAKTLEEFSEGEKNRDDIAVMGVRV